MQLVEMILKLNELHCKYRLHTTLPQKPENWSDWIITTTNGCIETAKEGPVSMSQVLAIEIDALEKKRIERMELVKETDHCKKLIDVLAASGMSYTKKNGVFMIRLNAIPQQAL